MSETPPPPGLDRRALTAYVEGIGEREVVPDISAYIRIPNKSPRAGNVLRPGTAFKLSIRVPTACDTTAGVAILKRVLEENPPYGAQVSFRADAPGNGWQATPIAAWLRSAVDATSQAYFGAQAVLMGEGGSIPFMGMLENLFPLAQSLITAILGPASNAHAIR